MAKDLKRTISLSDLGRALTEPLVPLYRNPRRDNVDDDRSLLDRTSDGHSGRYEAETQILEPSAPMLPERNVNTHNKINKPNKVVVTIMPYDGTNEGESISDWFTKYELMAETNSWFPDTMKDMLYFNLDKEPNRYCFQLKSENRGITYAQLRGKLIDRFTTRFDNPLNFHNLTHRKLKKGEPLLTYWNDKVDLIRKVDRDMNFASKMNHIIDGLDYELYKEVLKFTNINPPHNLDDLFHIINNLYQIDKSSKNQKELTQRTVRFDDRPMRRNDNFNRFGNNRNFRDSRTYYPREERRQPYNRDYGRNDDRRFGSNYNSSGNVGRNERRNQGFNERNSDNNSRDRSKERMTSQQSGQNQTVPKYTRTPTAGPICFFCNKPGHVQYNCPVKKSQISNKGN
jgi:hypothetical protein